MIKNLHRAALAAGLLATAAAWPMAPAAQPRSIEIRFAPQTFCWSYSGRANRFHGRFGAGQEIHVTARGEAPEVNRFVSFTHRASGVDVNEQGASDFTLRRSGVYDVRIWPRVIQGSRGRLRICAS